MYEIKTQAYFSAAHHLLNYEGECENQHGHNWMVEAFVQGESLDKSNILIDYKILKRELNAVLDTLDHKDLNDLPEFKGESPSSEMISAYIYSKLKEKKQKRTEYSVLSACRKSPVFAGLFHLQVV